MKNQQQQQSTSNSNVNAQNKKQGGDTNKLPPINKTSNKSQIQTTT